MSILKAGAASYDITPPVGIDMCGFGSRPAPAQSVHDPLMAKALYLEADESALIITSDLIGLDSDSVAEVREAIAEQTGLNPDAIMINCSHTHGGPTTPCLPTMGEVDPAYMHELLRKLISVGRLAYDRAEEAWVGHFREPVSVGINRREIERRNTPEPAKERGTVADYVDVLAVEGADGPIARLFVHAAHGVTLGGDNTAITADWMGYAQRYVERLTGGDCVALFGQGCCGNINSDPRGSFEIAHSQGRAMAGAVVKAAELAVTDNDITISAARKELDIPCEDPPPVEKARAMLEDLRAGLQQAEAEGIYGMVKFSRGLVEWGEWMVQQAERKATGLTIPYEVQAIRIGDTAIVGLPGEVFIEYAFNIEGRSPFGSTVVMGYTNGNPGYIPTAAAYETGGYEVDGAYRFYSGGGTMLKPELEGIILSAAEKTVQQLLAQ
ncbi:MAG: neutral/alkaline non-lysosomal ceramidase N-terminal domain-containing protein [Armatimonadota bacterium]